jgi:hypothetical protein
MDQPTFDVVFAGDLVAGSSLRDVELLLARSLRISVEQVHAMVTRGSATLQTNVSRVAAERWVEAFRQAGALCKLVPHAKVPPGGGTLVVDAPRAPHAPIVPNRASPGAYAEARSSAAAVGPIAPIVPSRAVPEAAIAVEETGTRLQHGQPLPQDPLPVAPSQSLGSPPLTPIAPVPVIAAAEARASQPAVAEAASSSPVLATAVDESEAAEEPAPEIPDLAPQPENQSPAGDELPPPVSIPLGDLQLVAAAADSAPCESAPSTADSLVQRLAQASVPDAVPVPDEETAKPLEASSHMLELDQGDPAARPIEIDTDAASAKPVPERRRADSPLSAGPVAASAPRHVPTGDHAPGYPASNGRWAGPAPPPRASRSGLWLGVMIAVIVGVGALMAGAGMLLSRQSKPGEIPPNDPNARATRLQKWQVQFTTATRFIVSYQCDDTLDRSILCWSPIRDQYECTCYRDGYEGVRFELQGVPTTDAEALALAGQRCQWKLAE